MSIQVKRTVKAYKMTSMREPVSIFEEFLSGLASERKGQLIAQSDAKMEIWEVCNFEKPFGTEVLPPIYKWIWKCDIDVDLLYIHRRKSFVKKQTQTEKQYFVVNYATLCKNMSAHHSRVARRDQIKESRCRRRSTILTSTKMTSTSTGMLCCQRSEFLVVSISAYKYTPDQHTVQALAKLVPKTHCMSEQEWRNLGVQQSLGWVVNLFTSCPNYQFLPWVGCSHLSKLYYLLLHAKRNQQLLFWYVFNNLQKVGSLHAARARASHPLVQVPPIILKTLNLFDKYLPQETLAQQVICKAVWTEEKYMITENLHWWCIWKNIHLRK